MASYASQDRPISPPGSPTRRYAAAARDGTAGSQPDLMRWNLTGHARKHPPTVGFWSRPPQRSGREVVKVTYQR